MATNIPVRELRNHTADIVRRAREGEIMHLTVNGEPVLELRPIDPDGWLDELASRGPVGTGWAELCATQRAADMELDWVDEA